ncbi:MAG: class E sortase, partial [Solirubrobacteraceae bacterium]
MSRWWARLGRGTGRRGARRDRSAHEPARRTRHDPPPPRRDAPGRTRRAVRHASTVLLLAGTLVLADVGITLLWQEPVTGVIALLRQGDLADELERLPAPDSSPLQRRVLASLGDDPERLAFLARRFKRAQEHGHAAARLRIPRIDTDDVVVWGTDTGDLRRGPGFYPSQPLPGAPGTAAIAGHRTTYGAPFRNVDRLRGGDEIRVDMSYGRFVYRVTHLRRVSPDAVWVLRRRGYDQLVLSACDPPFSAA